MKTIEKTNDPQDAQKAKLSLEQQQPKTQGVEEKDGADQLAATTTAEVDIAAAAAAAAAPPATTTTDVASLPILGTNTAINSNASAKNVFDSKDFINFLQEQDIVKVAWVTKDGALVSASLDGPGASANQPAVSAKTMVKSTDFWKDSGLFNSLDRLKSMDFFKSMDSMSLPSLSQDTINSGGDGNSSGILKDITLDSDSKIDGNINSNNANKQDDQSDAVKQAVAAAAAAASKQPSQPARKNGGKYEMSKEWALEYSNDHVDINYKDFFKSKNDTSKDVAAAAAATANDIMKNLPSKKRSASASNPPDAAVDSAATTNQHPNGSDKQQSQQASTSKNAKSRQADWNAVFKQQLGLSPALIQAAHEATPVSEKNKKRKGVAAKIAAMHDDHNSSNTSLLPSSGNTSDSVQDNSNSSNKKRRKSRKSIPEVKEFVDTYKEHDVLFGRGGRSNHHEGNKFYRQLVTDTQAHYRTCDKHQKTQIAESIVDTIHGRGGRFLELDKETQRWFITPKLTARRKAGQALRENNTQEARKAKREKYALGKKSAASSSTSTGGMKSVGASPIV